MVNSLLTDRQAAIDLLHKGSEYDMMVWWMTILVMRLVDSWQIKQPYHSALTSQANVNNCTHPMRHPKLRIYFAPSITKSSKPWIYAGCGEMFQLVGCLFIIGWLRMARHAAEGPSTPRLPGSTRRVCKKKKKHVLLDDG